MMPRKFTDAQLDEANALRTNGMQWPQIESALGHGIKNACQYRDHIGYVAEYSEERETQSALAAWNGLGDKQSFVDGWKLRAKRERSFS